MSANQETEVKKADEHQEKDWLVLDLEKPVTYNGMQINQLDIEYCLQRN